MLRRFFSLAFGVAMLLVTLSVCAGFAFTPTTLDFDAQGMVASEQVEPATSTSSNPSESTGSNVINLDGVLFETWVPEQEWVVPPNQPDASTPIEIGLRVTNNRREPIRIAKPRGIRPVLFGSGGITEFFNRLSNRTLQEFDFPEVLPGESVIFPIQLRLFWYRNALLAQGDDEYGHQWTIGRIQPNMSYLFRILHDGAPPYAGGVSFELETSVPPNPEHLVLQEEDLGDTKLNQVVANTIATPPVEVSLVSR